MADFAKRFRVVAHEGVQLSPVERRIVEAMGSDPMSIREVSAAAKCSLMAVNAAIEKLAQKNAVCELAPTPVKVA